MSRTIRIATGTTAALAVLGAVEALLCVALVAQWRLVQGPGPATLPEALTLVIVVLAAFLGCWLAATTLAAVLAYLPGPLGDAADRWARAWAPAVSRRVAAVLVGAVMGGAFAPGTALGEGPTGPSAAGLGLAPGFATTSPHRFGGDEGAGAGARAASGAWAGSGAGTRARPGERGPGFARTRPSPTESDTTTGSEARPAPVRFPDAEPAPAPTRSGLAPATSTPAPGWTPSRPVQRPLPSSGLVTGGSAPHRAADVVVHRGDTLWDIARRHLGPDATDAEVAHAWPAWHEANRAVIGDDPGLILPGQILRPPTAAALAASSSGAAQ